MMRVSFLMWVAAMLASASLAGCAWDHKLGSVLPGDDVPFGRADLESLADRLVGDYTGFAGIDNGPVTAGVDGAPVRISFREDGSYGAQCLTASALCPFASVDPDGSYSLTGIDVTGAVRAVTVDSYCHGELVVSSELKGMQLSADGQTLTFLRLPAPKGDIAAFSCAESVIQNQLLNYVSLTRLP